MRRTVIGQTGGMVLSDETIRYDLDQKRTVRYQYTKVKCQWMAWVCGPFHSRTYGACGFGRTKVQSKVTLKRNLASNYRYFGNVMFSDVDEADNVGSVDSRLLDENTVATPITVGSAGM